MNRSRWIKSNDEFKKARNSKTTEIWQVKYVTYMQRYNDHGYETYHDVFRMPINSTQAQVQAEVRRLVRQHVDHMRIDFDYDMEIPAQDEQGNDPITFREVFKIDKKADVRSYLSNGLKESAVYSQLRDEYDYIPVDKKC